MNKVINVVAKLIPFSSDDTKNPQRDLASPTFHLPSGAR